MPKKTAPKKETVKKATPVATSTSPKKQSNDFLPLLIAMTVLFLIVAGLLYWARGMFVAATVNGQIIYRQAVIRRLEQQAAKKVVQDMIIETLILQEAKKRNIVVTDADIEPQMKKIETSLASQGQTLDQALQSEGLSKSDFIQQLKLEAMLTKMIGPVSVSEKEVDDFMKQSGQQIPEGSDEKTLREQVKLQIQQQKLQGKIQDFIQNLQKQAKIQEFSQN